MQNAWFGTMLLALFSSPLMADGGAHETLKYWPQWRGPTWNGVAAHADPPITWSETENLRWKTPIEGRGCGTPIIWGDRIFLLTAIPLDKEMPIPDVIPAGTPNTGLDADEVSNWSTPRIFTHAGRRQVVLNGATVRSYDLATGELLWGSGGQSLGAIPIPAVGHGLVFATSGWRKDTLHAIKLGQRGDLTGTENVAWSLTRGTPYVPSPMLWGEELYLLEDRSFFSCLGAIDGERHYLKHRLPGSPSFSASPVGAANRIYLLSERGKTVVLQRGKEFKVLAINELGEKFLASPAIVGSAIYLRGDKHLFCFAKSSR